MCFSATASFVTSGALAVAGGASLKLAKRHERMIALIPLFFAIQQAIEGIQWLLPHPSAQSQLLGYAYLFFAFLLWPAYIPAAVYSLETDKRRNKFLNWLMILGASVSLGLFLILFIYPLALSVNNNIRYGVPAAAPVIGIGTVLYTLAVVGSLIASSRRALRVFCALVLAAEIAAAAFFLNGFASVWCFFAAVLSALIYLFFLKRWNGRLGSGTLIVKEKLPIKAR